MIKIILLIAALIAGLIVGPELAGNQGYVLISAADQTLEMSLTTMLILIVALFGVFFLIEYLLRAMLSSMTSTRSWFSGRKRRKARELTNNGLLKLVEGNWKQAEKLVIKAAPHSEAPLLNYLAAAEAAQSRGDADERDRYLQRAADCGDNELAMTLTKAKLQFRQEQYEEALANLEGLKQHHPRNPMMLSLLKDTYIKLNEWKSLLQLLPLLKKVSVITDDEKKQLNIEAECGLMTQIAGHKGSEGLLTHWHSLSRQLRQQPDSIKCLVNLLIERSADNEAFTLLKESLKKNPDEKLIALVPELTLSDYHPAIVVLKDLLRYNENNPVTHSALGQLNFRDGNYQQAREHLEKALEVRPDVADYALLVDTLEKLNESGEANNVSRQALRMALPNKA
ncbi:heme biosynthesis HemY N-terminal domain-containing protein [Veronia pacifica]|uniref:Heme biosynthesis protein HemY n=1 Tax=Veronia pacifica TaxID=1080227 RepID=A0A1C3EJK4_9GAMM|nr:heme biosynthesis HemY N-terminal domain-containing protein [Veronia pacifica]ODA33416.1 heme biosynthesis protein HemY [Veronia pacifica]